MTNRYTVMVLSTSTAVSLRIWIRYSRGKGEMTISDFTIAVTGLLGLVCGAGATALLDLSMHGPLTPAQTVLHMKV
jgi:hypothetical protein